jgi:DNA repair exonuclease SbcCD ATPase subunit
MSKKITESNSTKSEIYQAYQGLLAQLKDAQSQKLDPQAEIAAKKSAEVLTKAEATVATSVEEQIATLQKSFAGILSGLQTQFAEETAKFKNIQDAIDLKQAELEELVGIEKEAFTLAALVNTRKELSAKYDADAAERQATAQARLDEINQQMQQLRADTMAEIQNLKAQAKQERDREAEQYNYDFNRKKQLAQDALNDDLAATRKGFNEVIEAERAEIKADKVALDVRSDAISKREQKMDELEATVAAFPAKEAQIRAEVTEQVKKDEARTAAIKDSYAKREAENQKAIYENKIQLLESSNESKDKQIAELAAKLDEAYGKIQQMALESVKSSKETQAFDKFSSMFNDKKNA